MVYQKIQLVEKECIECEKVFMPRAFRTQVYCSRKCNYRAWVKANKEKSQQQRHGYYEEHKARCNANRMKNLSLREFGGNREAILKRDNYKCTVCGNMEPLIVHHKDRDRSHNDIGNLITLCRACHAKEHGINLLNHFKRGCTPWNKGLVFKPLA
jgi:5-methylcytosine-specific restriction endonuclease McrA